jgi:hypothetical protein
MFRRSQSNFGPELERRLHDSHVVRSDNDPVKDVCFQAALPNVLDQRFTGDPV